MKYSVIIVGCIAIAALGAVLLFNRIDTPAPLPASVPTVPVRPPTELIRPVSPLLPEDISRSVSAVSGEAHKVALEEIMGWVRNQQVLTDDDRDTLLAYISQSKPESLKAGEWEERVNEMLNFLRGQPGGVPGLADLLRRMVVADSDPVMRMYALQHLSMWVPDEPMPENRAAMIDLLKRLAETPGDPLAGSAVLFLDDLSRNPSLPDIEKVAGELIETQALRLAEDSGTKPDVQITALHTCAARGMKDAAPAARLIAANESLMIPLRKAAIYSLGELGSAGDQVLLESLAASDPTLAEAATPALKRLRR